MKKLLLLFLTALTCSAQVTLSQRGAYSLQLNDSGELLVPANGTVSNSVVTLSQLEGAVAAGRVAYFQSVDASGFSPSGTVKATNYAGPTLESTAWTNAAVTAANGEYIGMFISTNTFTSFASGLVSVDVYCWENSAGAGSIKAEVYVVNATTKIEEYEFEPSPAYQAVPSTTTPTKLTFSVPITDYTSTTNLHLAVKIKVSESSTPDPTIRLVGGGVYASHFSFDIPGALYVTDSELAAGGTFGPLTTTGTNASLTGTLSADSLSITNFNIDEINAGTFVVTNTITASNVVAGFVQVDEDAYAAGWNGSTNVPTKNAVYDEMEKMAVGTFGITVDGGGSAITSGTKGYIEIPYACTIKQITMLADQSGSVTLKVWKDTYSNYPPDASDAIGTNSITTATKSQDSTLTGWTTSVSAGDIVGFNVPTDATSITRVTAIIKVEK